MSDGTLLELLHAEIDGELDGQQRGELARRLLADPAASELREDLRRLCEALDALEAVEPPRQLQQSILDALPQSSPPGRGFWRSTPLLRYAAGIVGVLIAGAVAYETVHGPKPSTAELVGTMAPAGNATVLDTVSVEGGPLAGRVSLYRDRAGLKLKFELSASAPLDVLIATEGRTSLVNDVGGQHKPGEGKPGGVLTVELPGLRMSGQKVDLTFLMDGRQVGSATLNVPGGR